LVTGHGDRGRGARLLRAAHDLAGRLGAALLPEDLEALAGTGRVSLDRPESAPPPARLPGPGLTRREREILDHLDTGRTYAEIAEALVINEKTVSSHVSNLLRKTGTASRVELSRLARRTAS
jgi:DNA-binding NarL/FixJ family response regulator